MEEYEDLKDGLAKRLKNIEDKGHSRFIFVGSRKIRNLVNNIIDERHLGLVNVSHSQNWKDLRTIDRASFDIILLFDENIERIKKIAEALNIPKKILIPLW